jgi:hypothetical protein
VDFGGRITSLRRGVFKRQCAVSSRWHAEGHRYPDLHRPDHALNREAADRIADLLWPGESTVSRTYRDGTGSRPWKQGRPSLERRIKPNWIKTAALRAVRSPRMPVDLDYGSAVSARAPADGNS